MQKVLLDAIFAIEETPNLCRYHHHKGVAKPNQRSRFQCRHNKRSYRILLMVVFILYFSPVNAQKEFSLLGTWKVDSDATLSTLDQERRDRFSGLATHTIANVRYSLDNRIYDFKKDGTLMVSIKRDSVVRTSSGKWKLDESTNELQVTLSGGKRLFKIHWKSANRIVLQKEFDDSNSIFDGLTLYRAKQGYE